MIPVYYEMWKLLELFTDNTHRSEQIEDQDLLKNPIDSHFR